MCQWPPFIRKKERDRIALDERQAATEQGNPPLIEGGILQQRASPVFRATGSSKHEEKELLTTEKESS